MCFEYVYVSKWVYCITGTQQVIESIVYLQYMYNINGFLLRTVVVLYVCSCLMSVHVYVQSIISNVRTILLIYILRDVT